MLITAQNCSNFKLYTKTYLYGLVWENNHVWLLSNVEDINIYVLSQIGSQCVAWLFVCPLHLELNSNYYYDNVLCIWHYYFWIWGFPEVSSQKEKHFEQRQFSCFQAWTEHKKNMLDKLWKWSCNLELLKRKERAFSDIYSNYDLMDITCRAWLVYISPEFKLSTWCVPKERLHWASIAHVDI